MGMSRGREAGEGKEEAVGRGGEGMGRRGERKGEGSAGEERGRDGKE